MRILQINGSMRIQSANCLWKRIAKNKTIYLLIAPVILCYVIFNYIPMLGSLMAFNNYKLGRGFMGIFNSEWVGLKHFQRLFASGYIWIVLKNTLWLSFLKLIFCFPAPIIFALLLNELNNGRFKKAVQTITYLPNFLSAVVVLGLLNGMLSPTYGFLNMVRLSLGMDAIYFMADARYYRSILVIADLWKGFGWGAIVYLAAITGIDNEQYEAAFMDGASRFQRVLHVTLPNLSNIIALYLILNVGNILNAGFEMVFLTQSDTVMSVADIIDIYTYRMGLLEGNYSFGTAVGLFKSVVSLVLVGVANWGAKRLGTDGIW